MIRVFLAEWIGLRRRSFVLGWMGALLFFAFVATTVAISESGGDGNSADALAHTTVEQFMASDGLARGFVIASTPLGMIVLSLFAISIAREYSYGTIRPLLVSEPRRARLLAGKLLALSSFVAIALALAGLFSVAVSFLIAPGQGISTDEWTSAGSLSHVVKTIGLVIVSSIAWGLLGAVLAIATRSAALSIAAGAVGLLIIPTLLAQLEEGVTDRLPSTAFLSVAAGGNETLTITSAITTLAVYVLISVVAMFAIFGRRDVTD